MVFGSTGFDIMLQFKKKKNLKHMIVSSSQRCSEMVQHFSTFCIPAILSANPALQFNLDVY